MKFDFVESLLAENLLEEGAFCHFLNPVTGDPLYLPGEARDDGTPNPDLAVGAYVRSTSSKAFDAWEKRSTRHTVTTNRRARSEAQRQEAVLGQIEREEPEKFGVLLARFKNTSTTSPGEWVPSDAEKLELARTPKNRWMVKQVLDFAAIEANYPSSGNAAAVAD